MANIGSKGTERERKREMRGERERQYSRGFSDGMKGRVDDAGGGNPTHIFNAPKRRVGPPPSLACSTYQDTSKLPVNPCHPHLTPFPFIIPLSTIFPQNIKNHLLFPGTMERSVNAIQTSLIPHSFLHYISFFSSFCNIRKINDATKIVAHCLN